MSCPRFLSIAEQVAQYLKAEMVGGRWRKTLPGLSTLAGELGVNHKTIGNAMRILENEGVLEGQGSGRKRRILLPETQVARPLRVGILVPTPADCHWEYTVETRRSLEEAGHNAIVIAEARGAHGGTAKILTDPVKRLARTSALVKQAAADAWVVVAASRELLEWFCEQPMPAIAIFGRQNGLPMAGCRLDKQGSTAAATRELIRLGHRRIVLLCRQMRRLPQPGESERAFLRELEAHGIKPSPYHLPDWEESLEGFYAVLDSLFKYTPPTALIIDEPMFFVAILQFLGVRGIRVPQQVSLISNDPEPCFAWCRPSIAHIRYDLVPFVRRIVRWAAAVSHSKQDLRQTILPTEFFAGGTIGPAFDQP